MTLLFLALLVGTPAAPTRPLARLAQFMPGAARGAQDGFSCTGTCCGLVIQEEVALVGSGALGAAWAQLRVLELQHPQSPLLPNLTKAMGATLDAWVTETGSWFKLHTCVSCCQKSKSILAAWAPFFDAYGYPNPKINSSDPLAAPLAKIVNETELLFVPLYMIGPNSQSGCTTCSPELNCPK